MNKHLHEVTVSRDVVEKFYPLLADLILEVRRARSPCHMQPDSPHTRFRPSYATATTKLKRCAQASLHAARRAALNISRAQVTTAAADEKLVRLMQQDAVIRKVALTYILQRVTVGDLTSAEPLLLAAKEACIDA